MYVISLHLCNICFCVMCIFVCMYRAPLKINFTEWTPCKNYNYNYNDGTETEHMLLFKCQKLGKCVFVPCSVGLDLCMTLKRRHDCVCI